MKGSRRIFFIHHWCGLIVGVFLLVMSTSGSLLVFSEEMEEAIDSRWMHVDNPSGTYAYDASFGALHQQYPDWEIRLYNQPVTNEAVVYDLRKKEQNKKIYVHPLSGKVLHVNHQAHNDLHRWLLLLHYTWFGGTVGKTAVFFIGILFLLTLLTGFYVYRKSFFKVLRFKARINRQTTRSLHSSVHRIVGVWSLLFNLLIVVTGLFISGNIVVTALKPTAATAKKSGAIVSIDAIKNKIEKEHPHFQIHLIRVRPGGNAVQLSGRYQDDPFYFGNYYSGFTVNGTTGEVEKKVLLKEQTFLKRFISYCAPLHFGNWGGWPVKIIYSLLGLMPGLLCITGFVIWRLRGKKSVIAASG